MKGWIVCCTALAWLAAAASAEPMPRKTPRDAQWQGVVTHITDGDTLWVRPDAGGAPRKIRIHGIDAPESCQPHGPEARGALALLAHGRAVQVEVLRVDDYGRPLARLRLGQDDVARTMVQQGHAWSYRFRHNDGPYAQQEQQARNARRGLFAAELPERPYAFRRRHGSCKV